MTMKKIQAEIELIPKTDKMDAYLKKMKTISVGTATGGGANSVEENKESEKTVERGTSKSLKGLSGTLSSAFAGAFVGGLLGSALFSLIKGLSSGFEAFLSVLSVVAKLLGLMVMPFVNLLIPLLIPLLYILTPFVKMLNIMLIPLMNSMMEFFSKFAMPTSGGSVEDGEERGDVTGGSPNWNLVVDKQETFIDNFVSGLGDAFQRMIDISISLFEGEFPNITQAIDMLITAVVSMFMGAIKLTFTPFAILVLLLAGLITFIKILFEGTIPEKIVAIGVLISDIIEAWKNYVMSMINDFIDFIAFFIGGLVSIISPEWGKAITEFILEIKKWLNLFVDFVADFAGLMSITFFSLSATILQMINNIQNIINEMIAEAQRKISEIVSSAISNASKSIGDFFGGDSKSGKSDGRPYEDFIMKPNGQVLSFSPYDTIMGFRNPTGGVGGAISGSSSNSQTINITINGDVSGQELIRKIKTEMEKINRNDLMRRGVGIGGY